MSLQPHLPFADSTWLTAEQTCGPDASQSAVTNAASKPSRASRPPLPPSAPLVLQKAAANKVSTQLQINQSKSKSFKFVWACASCTLFMSAATGTGRVQHALHIPCMHGMQSGITHVKVQYLSFESRERHGLKP